MGTAGVSAAMQLCAAAVLAKREMRVRVDGEVQGCSA